MGISKAGMMDMKRSEKERKDEYASIESNKGKQYSYGTRINLDSAEIDKLGIKYLPAVGDEYRIVAVAKVVSTNSNEHESGGASSGITLQITHMRAFHQDEIEKAKKTEAKEGKTEPKGESKSEQLEEEMMGTEAHGEGVRKISNWK